MFNSLKNMQVKESQDMIVATVVNEYYYKINTHFIYFEKLMRDREKCETYAYDFCEQAEIMGWKLPETEFVKDNIYQVMADILFEASFFGYDQEDLPKAKKELNSAIQEVETLDLNSLKSWDDVKKELNIHFEKDDRKDTLYSTLVSHENDYYSYLKEKELKDILELIQQASL